MKFLFCLGAFFTLVSGCCAAGILSDSQQLLIVTSNGWEDNEGRLQLFEKSDAAWNPYGEPIPVTLGKTGMAWGIGLHTIPGEASLFKVEGDRKTPAGIFSLGCAFGFLPVSAMGHLKIAYIQLDEFTEAVDDPHSSYYNCIVDNREVPCDWNSSEKMGSIPLYELGLAVNHNWPQPQPGKGSAIFFHIWRNKNSYTYGCTAMERGDLAKVLCWLDGSKNPVLVQLPFPVYSELQDAWDLPELNKYN